MFLLLASIIVHFLTLSITSAIIKIFVYKIELHLSNKIWYEKFKTFAKKKFPNSRKKYVSLHQLDMHQADCTKSIFHQVDMHQVDTAPS